MESISAPDVCWLQPWLPDQVPGLMSLSPSSCKIDVIFCMMGLRCGGGILPRVRRQRHCGARLACFLAAFVVAALCVASSPMSKSTVLTNWHPASWHSRPATQQPRYSDLPALERAVASLSRLPPLVVSWEIDAL